VTINIPELRDSCDPIAERRFIGSRCANARHEWTRITETFGGQNKGVRSLYLIVYRFVPGVDEIVSSIFDLILV
jgi:hypothetical protein